MLWVNILAKSELFSSYGLGEDLDKKGDIINQLRGESINNAICIPPPPPILSNF